MLVFERFFARSSGSFNHFSSDQFQKLQSKTTDGNVALAVQLAKHSFYLDLLSVRLDRLVQLQHKWAHISKGIWAQC